MLESTNLTTDEVMDNIDTFSKWLDENDMSEYEQAFISANK